MENNNSLRKVKYFAGEVEVSEQEWFELLNEQTNFKTLRVEYVPVDIDFLVNEIERLKDEVKTLKKNQGTTIPFDLPSRPRTPWDNQIWYSNEGTDIPTKYYWDDYKYHSNEVTTTLDQNLKVTN